jgi:hypothetical protein
MTKRRLVPRRQDSAHALLPPDRATTHLLVARAIRREGPFFPERERKDRGRA